MLPEDSIYVGLLEDSIYVGENHHTGRDFFLKNGRSIPRQEPSVIATMMAAATSRLGIVPTHSTFAYAPYLVARIVGSLDQISGGRGGWNMVTGSSDLSAQNFGMDRLPPHDLRYGMAEEYVEICKKLWGAWQPDSIVADEQKHVLIDPMKVHTIDYQGRYYSSRFRRSSAANAARHIVVMIVPGLDPASRLLQPTRTAPVAPGTVKRAMAGP